MAGYPTQETKHETKSEYLDLGFLYHSPEKEPELFGEMTGPRARSGITQY